jgi:SAM-dependent methyltransferase
VVITTSDKTKVLPAYAEQAAEYEAQTETYQAWRRDLVELLPAQRGDEVVDVGCGTGLCFPLIQEKVREEGAIVGVEESDEMLKLARGRVSASGWPNVTLVAAPAERAVIPIVADAAVFCAVHDVMQSPAALDNVFGYVRPGAWVVAAGGKWAPPWMVPLNMLVYGVHAPYVRDFRGFDRPWRLIERYLDDFRVTEVAAGCGYLAIGRARERAGRR